MNQIICVDFKNNTAGFDYEAYRQRAERRLSAARRRAAIVAAAESLSAILIGICCVICTAVAIGMF